MLSRLLPKETCFFDYFEQLGALNIQGSEALVAFVSGKGDMRALAARIKEIEHQADAVTHRCIEAIHKTFITPMDRTDIHELIKRLDDIIDSIDAAVSRIMLYEMTEMRPEALELAALLVRATTEIEAALKGLRNIKNAQAINERCIAIYQLENEADSVLRSALARLFKEEERAVLVIKWKEIYERLEKATDRCENVANIIQGVVIEAS